MAEDVAPALPAGCAISNGTWAWPFEGSVDAIGPGLSYTTVIDKMPVTLNLRYYHEFGAHNHFEGDPTIALETVRF